MPKEMILLVDDEDANLRLLTQWLIPLGYDIQLASNGQEAVQKAREIRPDLIILDIMMPVMDGYEACRLIKADPETKNIPVIMVTALNDRESKLKGLSVFANDFLSKPIDQSELTIRVTNLLKIKAFEDFMLRHNQILEGDLRMVIEKNVDGLIIVDVDGILRFMNPAAESLFGDTSEKLIGKHMGLPLLSGVSGEMDVYAKDGTQRTVEMRSAAINWEEKDSFLVSLRDITEHKQRVEMEEWNSGLKKRLLQSTATIREQCQALKLFDSKSPVAIIQRTFDGFFELVGDREATHARTVSTLVTDVAKKMGLDAETVATFRLAALLHDAGKFGSLTLSLHKQLDEMSESEAGEYRQHPLRGEEMFRSVEELTGILPLIRHHHEIYDGSGFPDGLWGEAIPLGARLIAIADHIEKTARSVEHDRADYSLMSARYLGGTLFDPLLVMKFQSVTRMVYFEGKKAGTVAEVEIEPAGLVSGMTLARDVESGSGVLLMQRGRILDSSAVFVIRSQYRKSPPQHGIFVLVKMD